MLCYVMLLRVFKARFALGATEKIGLFEKATFIKILLVINSL